ncbi:hypothetical protein ACLOJK_036857 [Asimina triloba]
MGWALHRTPDTLNFKNPAPSYCACYKRCDNLKRGEMVDTEGESLLGVVPSLLRVLTDATWLVDAVDCAAVDARELFLKAVGDTRELFLKATVDAGELVWNQGLLKLFGICHDVELDRVQVDQRMSFRKRAFQRVCGGSPTNHE